MLPSELKPKPGRTKRNRQKDKYEIKKNGKFSRHRRKIMCA